MEAGALHIQIGVLIRHQHAAALDHVAHTGNSFLYQKPKIHRVCSLGLLALRLRGGGRKANPIVGLKDAREGRVVADRGLDNTFTQKS